jgi:hypothetical protein
MLGRLTPPGDRESELRGNKLCNHTTVQKPTHHTVLITFFLAKINRIFRPWYDDWSYLTTPALMRQPPDAKVYPSLVVKKIFSNFW